MDTNDKLQAKARAEMLALIESVRKLAASGARVEVTIVDRDGHQTAHAVDRDGIAALGLAIDEHEDEMADRAFDEARAEEEAGVLARSAVWL